MFAETSKDDRLVLLTWDRVYEENDGNSMTLDDLLELVARETGLTTIEVAEVVFELGRAMGGA